MRRAPIVLVACAVLLAGCGSGVGSENASLDPRGGVPAGYPLDADVATPLAITALSPAPIPVSGADGKVHVAYELEVLNVAPRPVTLTQVQTLADGPAGAVIATLGQSEVAARTIQVPKDLPPGPDGRPATDIAAGRTVVLVLDAVFASRDDVPATLAHRVSAALGEPTPGSEALGALYPDTASQVGGEVGIDPASPVVIGPPLAGDGWIANNGCCAASRHRGAVIAFGGRLNGAERFAIDWVRSNSGGEFFAGDGARNEDFYGYGAELLAVADGTVAAVVTDQPDIRPLALPAGVPIDELAGNYVVIDIGEGNYAFYAHLIPGSASVTVGEKVSRGQVIGKLGNSGNTSGPHLHFQITRAPLPLSGDNTAYEIDHFVFVGSNDISTGAVVEGPDAGERQNQLPLNASVVNFPAVP